MKIDINQNNFITTITLKTRGFFKKRSNESPSFFKPPNQLTELIDSFNTNGKTNPKIDIILNAQYIDQLSPGNVLAQHDPNSPQKINVFKDVFGDIPLSSPLGRLHNRTSKIVSSKDFLINFITFHEVGHSIQAHLLENNQIGNPLVSDVLSQESEHHEVQELRQQLALIAKENFADLFAAHTLISILPDKTNLLSDLDKIQQFRYFADYIKVTLLQDGDFMPVNTHSPLIDNRRTMNPPFHKYYTANNLQQLIEQQNTGATSYKDFSGFLTIANKNINQAIKEFLQTDFKINQSLPNQTSAQLGYLHSLFFKNDPANLKTQIDNTITHLENEYQCFIFSECEKQKTELTKKIYEAHQDFQYAGKSHQNSTLSFSSFIPSSNLLATRINSNVKVKPELYTAIKIKNTL